MDQHTRHTIDRAMQLECLHAPAEGPTQPVDLLLVHGICVGGWVWQPHFMPYLARAGFNVHALSLRGHGGSGGSDSLPRTTLGDYAKDFARTIAGIDRPVVAVGHSLGGAVLQAALAGGTKLAGAVLMASVPPYGLLRANLAMMTLRPALWREIAVLCTAGVQHANPEVLRDGLFSNRLDQAAFAAFAARARDESPLAGLELQGLRPFAPPAWMAPPVLVLGGTEDRFIPASEVWMTAAWYGGAPVMLEGMSHTMMLDPDWQSAADAILAWLDTSGLAKPRR